jgi:fused signal recognition particle receptor
MLLVKERPCPRAERFFWSKRSMAQDDKSSSEEKRFFSRLRKGLAKTRDQFTSGMGNLLLGEKEISEEALEDLETALLMTDVGR